MADKILNTRIQLKYDTLTNWQTKNTLLKQGEVAFVAIETNATGDHPTNFTNVPNIMYKVGPGYFNDLKWGSALAADVYAWAKQETLPVVRNDAEGQTAGNVISSIAWDSANNRVVYTTASVATSEGMADLQEALEGLTQTVNAMYTNEQIDAAIKVVADDLAEHEGAFAEFQTANTQAIADAKAGAETTAAAALATARTEITAEIDADVKALADGAVATAQGRADDAYALAGTKADAATTYSKDDVDGLIAPLATTEALNGVKTTAEQGVADAAAAQKTADDVTARVEAFLDGEEIAGTVDTLKEIQAELETLGEAVQLETQFAAKADKVTGATAGNFAGLDANGNLTDSGAKAADFATAAQGAKADSAVQSVSVATSVMSFTFDLIVDDKTTSVRIPGLGSIAGRNETDYVLTEEFTEKTKEVLKSHITGSIDYPGAILVDGKAKYIGGWDNLKVKQTAVAETGTADKTLKIRQNENGEITATPIAIQIATSQVTGLDDTLAAKANDADLAAVAKSGLIDDLSIGEGTVLIFDCGGAE